MNKQEAAKRQDPFHALTPDTVIGIAEQALGGECTNLYRPLNSYINRVCELERRDGSGLIVKFYRPGRWTSQALQEEHSFLHALAQQEIPVIAPLVQQDGTTLGNFQGIHYALFEKCGGRSYDEYTDDQWLELGRLLGRIHSIAEQQTLTSRVTMVPDRLTRDQVDFLLHSGLLPADMQPRFQELTSRLIADIQPLFADVTLLPIHGDCHFSNIIYRPGESFYLIDFDDMAMGPPVQDFWMLLPGYVDDCFVEVDLFLEGYETFRHFDRRTLRLIEPLRAMRYIHYIAWCAHQVVEDGQTRVIDNFGSREYWQLELDDLADQLERIAESDVPLSGNMMD